ncbi:MAG: metallophosphoesterase [Thermodesulfobacteriota bacterium]
MIKNRMSLLTLLPVFIFGLLTCDNSGDNGIISSWVQAGPNGATIARVITQRDGCPEISLNGISESMDERQAPSNDFPVLVCEIIIPQDTVSASVSGRVLKLPVENPKRLIILGDTGCRLETGDPPQACNDPRAWPFKQISETAASFNPDLVIHVGDYLYREDPCPEGDSGCQGSPSGDNFITWDADFFTPADKLLRSAPWVYTRGNHEECGRAGIGWFTFLDPNPPFSDCQEFTPPYVVDIGAINLLMLDSSAAKDNSAPDDQVEVYKSQIATLENASGDNAWFVTHHPFWGIGESSGELFMINETLEAASDNVLSDAINLVISGHIHFFELLNFVEDRQPQLIVGMSGTEVDDLVTTPFPGLEIGGATVNQGFNLNEFGFALLELVGGVWEMSIRDVGGSVLLECEIDGASATCFP